MTSGVLPEVLTPDEVAEFLRVSKGYVRDLVKLNVLRWTKLPNSRKGTRTRKSRIRIYASSVYHLAGLDDPLMTEPPVSDEEIEIRERLARERLKKMRQHGAAHP